jgi:hypothetical protein
VALGELRRAIKPAHLYQNWVTNNGRRQAGGRFMTQEYGFSPNAATDTRKNGPRFDAHRQLKTIRGPAIK